MLYHKLHYIKIGNGKHKVVFLHGWGANLHTFKLLASAMKDCTCYLIDLYGFGDTNLPDVMDIYDYAIQLYLFFVAKKINNFTLVGHSFGGRIATILASITNLKINKLVLIDSAGLKPRFNILTYIRVKAYKITKWLVYIGILPRCILSKFGSKDCKSATNNLRITFVKVVNQHLNYLIPLISVPTMVVWGTKDKTTPVYMAKYYIKHIANAHVVYYHSGGHFSYLNNYNLAGKLNDFCKE